MEWIEYLTRMEQEQPPECSIKNAVFEIFAEFTARNFIEKEILAQCEIFKNNLFYKTHLDYCKVAGPNTLFYRTPSGNTSDRDSFRLELYPL